MRYWLRNRKSVKVSVVIKYYTRKTCTTDCKVIMVKPHADYWASVMGLRPATFCDGEYSKIIKNLKRETA